MLFSGAETLTKDCLVYTNSRWLWQLPSCFSLAHYIYWFPMLLIISRLRWQRVAFHGNPCLSTPSSIQIRRSSSGPLYPPCSSPPRFLYIPIAWTGRLFFHTLPAYLFSLPIDLLTSFIGHRAMTIIHLWCDYLTNLSLLLKYEP